MLISILTNQVIDAKQAVITFAIATIVFIISLDIREFTHALTAYKLGDPTPKVAGRLTLNPFKHLDPAGFFFYMLVGVGWSKPAPVNPLNFKQYRKGIRIYSISGIIANFIFGLLAAVCYLIFNRTIGCPNEFMMYFYMTLQIIMQINSFMVLLNILPIFPLSGFNFVTSFMNSQNKFITFNIKHGVKILYGIMLGSLVIDLLFGVDLFAFYLNLLYNFVYLPLALI